MMLRNRLNVLAQGVFASVLVFAGSARAENDLDAGIDAAAKGFRSLVAWGLGWMAIIVTVLSLGTAWFWLWRGDPRAKQCVWGTLVSGVLFGVAMVVRP